MTRKIIITSTGYDPATGHETVDPTLESPSVRKRLECLEAVAEAAEALVRERGDPLKHWNAIRRVLRAAGYLKENGRK
jgi:hypothetical protein